MEQAKCDKCDKQALFMCSLCNSSKYCSADCQKLDWPQHKQQCPEYLRRMQEPEETEEEKIQNIKFYVGQLYTILKPVTLTILTSILWVKLNNPSTPYFATNEIPRQVASVGTSFGTSGNTSSDNQQSLIIAGIIMGQIVVATVIMACLFRYGQVKIIYGILGVLILMLLGLFGYQLALMLLTISNIPFDWISFAFCLWNFVAVGLASIFWKGPQVLQQGYLVLMSSMMAFSLSSLPALVTWILLGFLAVWDLIAVLCPYGPLRIMLESAQKNNTELPAALIYSAMVWVGMAAPPSPKHPLESPAQISPLDLPQPLNVDEIVQDKPKVAVVDPSNEANNSTITDSPREAGNDVTDNLETKRLTSEIEMRELNSSGQSNEPQEEEEEETGLKLGLGDFVFYSVLLTDIQKFYLKNRQILIPSEKAPIKDKVLSKAIDLCLSVAGVSPVLLAQYPELVGGLKEYLTVKHSHVANIENTYMTSLVHALNSEQDDLVAYMEQLSVSDKDESYKLFLRLMEMVSCIQECTICMCNDATIVFQCGHSTCSTCSERVRQCPFCRARIESRLSNKEQRTEQVVEAKLPKFKLVKDPELFFASRIKGLLMKTTTLDDISKLEISLLAAQNPMVVLEFFDGDSYIKSEETYCYVLGSIFKTQVIDPSLTRAGDANLPSNKKGAWTLVEKDFADIIQGRINSPNRLIRFISSVNGGMPTTDAKPELKKVSRPMIKWIAGCLNRMDNSKAQLEIQTRLGFWAWLFKKIHVGSQMFKNYTQTQRLAQMVRGNIRFEVKLPMATFHELFNRKDLGLFEFVNGRPGLLFRYLRAILIQYRDVSKGLMKKMIQPVFKQLSSPQLIESIYHLEKTPGQAGTKPFYKVKDGSFFEKNEITSNFADLKWLNTVVLMLKTELQSRNIEKELWVDTTVQWELQHLKRGRQGQMPEWVSTVNATGDKVSLDRDGDILLFIHWMQKDDEVVDLDLSALLYDDNNRYLGTCDFTTLQSRGLSHSGDLRQAPAPLGSSEYITFKLNNVSSEVSKIAIQVYSYSRVSFENLPRCLVGIGTLDSSAKGTGPNGCHVISACCLLGSSTSNICGYIDTRDSSLTFVNSNMKGTKDVTASGNSGKISIFLENFQRWTETRIPPNFDFIIKQLYHMFSSVRLVEKDRQLVFKIRKGEKRDAFVERVLSASDFDEAVDAEAEVVDKEDMEVESHPVIYFGSKEVELPFGSTIISNTDPKLDSDDCIWTTDPYSCLV
ncbi:Presenilin-1 [Boothiomyces sp. JEL0866]|nr:Presenilin-1 [Boothiomyces sp. JEL0866]KAJ3324836.1 Presenilin-1 [Boothiomyces sp. JEL0866]